EPAVDELNFGDDESINVTITVSVKPEFELADYKGLPLTKRVYKVLDEEVDKEIDRLREAQAELVPVEERGAEAGDIVTVTLTGRFEPPATKAEPAEDEAAQGSQEAEAQPAEAAAEAGPQEAAESEEVKQEDVEITVGGPNVLKEHSEALTGVQLGDERAFAVTYPAEYKPERFAGRQMNYAASVTAVRRKELP